MILFDEVESQINSATTIYGASEIMMNKASKNYNATGKTLSFVLHKDNSVTICLFVYYF